MNRTATILSLALVLLPGAIPANEAGPPDDEIRVQADSNEYCFETQTFISRGNVRITRGKTVLTADYVTGNIDTVDIEACGSACYRDSERTLRGERLLYKSSTGDMEASGSVEFRDATRSLTGDTFRYNRLRDEGIASDAVADVEGLLVRAREMSAIPGRYTVSDSTFTTCNLSRPHYYLEAKELLLTPGKRLVARRVSIVLLGKRLFTVPRYTVKLDQREQSLGLPAVGVSQRYGAYLGYEFDLSREPGTVGNMNIRLSSKEVFQGALSLRRIGGSPVFLGLSYKEPFYGGRRDDLLLTRAPEVGYRFYSRNAGVRAESSEQVETLYRQTLSPTLDAKEAGRLNFMGQISAGEFIEEPGHTRAGRLDARAFVWLGAVPVGRSGSVSPGMSLRYSTYRTGEQYADLGLRLAAMRRFGARTYISATYVNHSISGTSPFEFDQVELPQELAARVGFPVGRFSAALGIRYDLADDSMFDSEVSIAVALHCLEPRITWRSRFREISLDVGVIRF